MGGVAIFVAVIAGVLLGGWLSLRLTGLPWGLLAGALIIFGVGVWDDLRELPPQAKLVGEIIAATVAISSGVVTNFFTPRIASPSLAQLANILVTYMWLVGITNAINLLDNMDGLAAGISLIMAGFLSFFFWQSGNVGLLVVSLALSGALLGFLFYNFPPASIFMGDSGSLFLGFTLASLAIARQPQASNVLAVIGVPVLLFLLPILDTILVTVTRLLRGQSPARGGRDHTSHRLVAFGLNERQTVLALYLVALAAGLAGLAIERVDYWLSLVFVPVVIIILALATAYLGGMKLVLSSDTRPRTTALNRLMLDLTYRRRVLEVLLDFLLISLAYYLAFLVYYRARLDSPTLLLFLQSLPIAVGSAFLSFYIFGIYRGVWRYVGLDDILGYIKAALGTLVLVTLAVWLIHSRSEYPLAIFLIFASLLFVELAASRSSFRLLDRLSAQRTRQAEQRVLICGAGDAGELALRWILMNPQLAYRPVGFLDQDTYKIGRHIHGVPVLGPPEEIATVLQEHAVDGVILTSEYLSDQQEARQQILTCIHQRGGWARTLRLEFELLE